MSSLCIRLAVLAISIFKAQLVYATSGVAKEERLISWPQIHWGQCLLDTDPRELSSQESHLCIQGASSLDISLDLKRRQPKPYHYSQIYLGAHPSSNISFHWQGYGKTSPAMFAHTPFSPPLAKDSKLATIVFGNPSLHRLRLAIGKQPIAFGINHLPQGAYLESLNPQDFWSSPPFASTLTFDNLIDFTAEISLAAELDLPLAFTSQASKAISLRLSHDSSAWYQTRFFLSAFCDQQGEKRLGAGLINTSPDGGHTQIEWVRKLPRLAGQTQAFEQLIRLLYISKLQKHKRMYVLYDDIRFQERLASIGQQFYTSPQLYLNLALSYKKDETPGRQHQWSLIGGLGAHL